MTGRWVGLGLLLYSLSSASSGVGHPLAFPVGRGSCAYHVSCPSPQVLGMEGDPGTHDLGYLSALLMGLALLVPLLPSVKHLRGPVVGQGAVARKDLTPLARHSDRWAER